MGLFQSYISHICTKSCLYLPFISPIYYQNQDHISVICLKVVYILNCGLFDFQHWSPHPFFGLFQHFRYTLLLDGFRKIVMAYPTIIFVWHMYDKCIVPSYYCDLHEFYQARYIPNMCLKCATYIKYTRNMPELCRR